MSVLGSVHSHSQAGPFIQDLVQVSVAKGFGPLSLSRRRPRERVGEGNMYKGTATPFDGRLLEKNPSEGASEVLVEDGVYDLDDGGEKERAEFLNRRPRRVMLPLTGLKAEFM